MARTGAGKKSGLDQKVLISDEMAQFMFGNRRANPSGEPRASRAEMTKKIWSHIKKNDLQDDDNRRNINPDDVLEPILGNKQISMFKIAAKISEHVVGK